MKQLMFLLGQHRFRLLLVLFVFLAVVLGVVIVPFESVSGAANISSLNDGIWWSITTMTGVGYGDVYPVTGVGRLIGVVLEILGVVVFGLIVGYIAVALFRIRDDFYWKRVFERFDRLETRLEKLEKRQRFLVKNGDEEERRN